MKELTSKIIDESRKEGFKPCVILCLLNEKRLLFLLKKEYKLWQLPQGSIKNSEEAKDACLRILTSELGSNFLTPAKLSFVLIGEDQMEILPEKLTEKEIMLDNGKMAPMKGKRYYFFSLEAESENVDLTKTQFDDWVWLPQKGALTLAQKIYQPGKRRITTKIVEYLKEQKLI